MIAGIAGVHAGEHAEDLGDRAHRDGENDALVSHDLHGAARLEAEPLAHVLGDHDLVLAGEPDLRHCRPH
jgi:hypothetical protein